MEASLKSRILSYIERRTSGDPNAWVHKGDIEREAILAGFLADGAARRMRELHVEGLLERREKGVSIEYRYSIMGNRLKEIGLT